MYIIYIIDYKQICDSTTSRLLFLSHRRGLESAYNNIWAYLYKIFPDHTKNYLV